MRTDWCGALHRSVQQSTDEHSTARQSRAQQSTDQHITCTVQQSRIQHRKQHSTYCPAQHSPTQPSTVQQNTAQHRSAQDSKLSHSELHCFPNPCKSRLTSGIDSERKSSLFPYPYQGKISREFEFHTTVICPNGVNGLVINKQKNKTEISN